MTETLSLNELATHVRRCGPFPIKQQRQEKRKTERENPMKFCGTNRGTRSETGARKGNRRKKGQDMTETLSLNELATHVLARIQRKGARQRKEERRGEGKRPAPFKTDAPDLGASLQEAYEERLAIAEVKGQLPPDQAKRIATQDAFIMVLTSLPWEEDQGKKDWLNLRIKKSQDWLSSQNWEG